METTGNKSRWRKLLWIALPLLAVGLVALPRALAFGRHHCARASSPEELASHLGFGLEHLLDEVDATAAQRARAKALADERAPALFALMREGRELRGQLKDALLAEELDRAKVDALRGRLGALTERAADQGLDAVYAISEVLTPAQRREVAARLARFHGDDVQ